MTSAQIEALKRAISKLGFEGKTYLSRREIGHLIEELTLNRDYEVADFVQSLDPARLFEFLR
jgi:hypothetical protein